MSDIHGVNQNSFTEIQSMHFSLHEFMIDLRHMFVDMMMVPSKKLYQQKVEKIILSNEVIL